MHITSGSNGRLRTVRKLSSKKYRDETGQFAAEGKNLVTEAAFRGADIEYVLAAGEPEMDAALLSAELGLGADVPVYTVSPELFGGLTDAEHGVDVLAVVNKPFVSADSLREALRDGGNILVLDRVQDPGNIGTLIRTAAAAGYRAVICIKGTGDVYSPKVLRSTAGLIYALPILYVDGAYEAVALAAELGRKFAVTVPTGGVPYYEADLANNVALVIGNEGRGVSDEITDAAELLVTIPMAGGTESLNASVAGAILMYENIRRQKELQ